MTATTTTTTTMKSLTFDECFFCFFFHILVHQILIKQMSEVLCLFPSTNEETKVTWLESDQSRSWIQTACAQVLLNNHYTIPKSQKPLLLPFKNKRDGLLSYRFWRSTYLKFSWREYFVILWKFTPCLFLLSVMPFMFLCGGVFIYLFLLAVILIYRTYNWLSVLFSHLTTKILTINISVIACSLEKMWWNTFIVTHFWQLSVFIFRWQIHL